MITPSPILNLTLSFLFITRCIFHLIHSNFIRYLNEKKKKKKKPKTKKEEMDEEDEFFQPENVAFGEVVQQPPQINVIPKLKKKSLNVNNI